MSKNYKKGKICVGSGQQEEYLSQFQFKGNNNLKGIWIVQDWKGDFYQFKRSIRRSNNAKNGTFLFNKIAFERKLKMSFDAINYVLSNTDIKRILSDDVFRLGVKRKKAFSINHKKEISFFPRGIAKSECENWYSGCENNKDCLKCPHYYTLKGVKKINIRFKIKELLSISISKKRFKAIVEVAKTHYLVRGFSMTKTKRIW